MTDALPFPLAGVTLILGPTNVGKTTLTARALQAWLAGHGPEGVVVLDFAPELRRGDRLIGGRLSRVTDVPAAVWHGVIEARAPRAESRTPEEALAKARANAEASARLIQAAPADPVAVFVNDATIPYQSPARDPERMLRYCRRARVAVLNAFAGTELGTDDPVSREEQRTLDVLARGVDRVVRLAPERSPCVGAEDGPCS